MNAIYLIIKILPFWSIPITLIFIQLGIFFHRKDSNLKYLCFFGSFILIIITTLWLMFCDDMHSNECIKMIFSL